MSKTRGSEILQQIVEGGISQLPSEYLAKTRDEVCVALDELLDVGARIRPLMVGKEKIGWVRGIHLTERKHLKRYIYNEIEYVEQLLQLGTSLTPEQISDLNLVEMRSISRLIQAMTQSDLRLYPFLAAFTTTSTSEQLWYSKGLDRTSFQEKVISMPDGVPMRIIAASDHARLWATLCNYRIQAKARLDASSNAVMIVRSMVGKNADSLSNEVKSIHRSLLTDSYDPWREVVQLKADPNLDDGWAHGEDDSIEGLRRELAGMANNDRHEQVVEMFRKQQQEQVEARALEVQRRTAERQRREMEDDTPTQIIPMTQAELVAAAERWRNHNPLTVPSGGAETQSSLESRLAKYS